MNDPRLSIKAVVYANRRIQGVQKNFKITKKETMSFIQQ